MDVLKCLLLMMVFASYVSCAQVNVALNKGTSTTSGVYGVVESVWDPSGVVDGDHLTLASGSSCFHSARSPADWTVDLGQQYQLYDITVYFRNGYEYRTANSSIYVDNDPTRVCYTFPSTISDNPTHLTCNETARYVTIRNPGDGGVGVDSLNICEVEILGCTGGYHGLDCNVDCHCDECDRWTGICKSTCRPGWVGDRCNIACNGTYGSSCINSCDARHCSSSSSSCDPVNGTCDYGCLPRWSGLDCITKAEECWSYYSGLCHNRHCLNQSSCQEVNGTYDNPCETEAPNVAAGSENTKADMETIALSTTVGVSVVVIVTLTVLLFRMKYKLKKRFSEKSSTDANRSTPDATPTTDPTYTEITTYDSITSTTTANYETLGPTENNNYTGLEG